MTVYLKYHRNDKKKCFCKGHHTEWASYHDQDAPVVIRLDSHRACAPIAQRLKRFTSHQKVPKSSVRKVRFYVNIKLYVQ